MYCPGFQVSTGGVSWNVSPVDKVRGLLYWQLLALLRAEVAVRYYWA